MRIVLITYLTLEGLMKKGIHPRCAPVVVRDTSTGTCFVTRSTLIPDQTIELGREVTR